MSSHHNALRTLTVCVLQLGLLPLSPLAHDRIQAHQALERALAQQPGTTLSTSAQLGRSLLREAARRQRRLNRSRAQWYYPLRAFGHTRRYAYRLHARLLAGALAWVIGARCLDEVLSSHCPQVYAQLSVPAQALSEAVDTLMREIAERFER
ncbi:hypothetical protein, partial [Actomonas aquatica]|uniref:Uncharacterized protein n=1 Tax=Actomonas aquatica TaxID=2866162 RepID=A0ABZ1C241_9BACT